MTLPPCLLKTATGIPCPSCGLTRATLAMIRGDWFASLAFHPLGIVFAAEVATLTLVLVRRKSIGLPVRPPQPVIDWLIIANVVALLVVWGARLAGLVLSSF